MAKRAAEAAQQLVPRASRSCRFPDESASQTAELTRALDSIVALVHRQAGIELRGYKPAPVLNRIQRRMSLRGVRSLGDYESLLQGDPAELESLVRGIPIHVTGFFRDPAAWHVLNNEVIGPLAADCGPGEHIRIWTPACASGEEAYSIAMLVSEYLDTAGHAPDFQLFATDASAEIVARANRGAFPARALSSMSASRRARFFHEVDGGYHVDRGLREKMVFATQNLLVDPPFTHLDLVTCRNLLIYLDPEAVQRVLYRLHSSLRGGGYLFLGPAEGFSFRQPGFEVVSSGSRIYRKDGPFSDVPFRVAAPSKRERDETRARSRPDRAVSGSFGDDNVERSAREWSGALRTSQEELAVSRMELQALNEELNASREKLNAAHEELSRAALQLEDKTAELEMQSRVLSTGEVTTLFLDLELRVRWFTPAVRNLFPLRNTDAGRRITDLVQRFEDPTFIADLQQVMLTGEPHDREVLNDEHRWFLLRMRPYVSEGRTGGVAITFTDMSGRRQAGDSRVLHREECGGPTSFTVVTHAGKFA